MTNPLTDFKNDYAGEVSVIDELTKDLTTKMISMYVATYNKIFKATVQAKSDNDFYTTAKQQALLKSVVKILKNYRKSSGKYLKTALDAAMKDAVLQALEDLPGSTEDLSFYQEFNEEFVQYTYQDTYSHVAALTDKMTTEIKSIIRQDMADIMRYASINGITRKKAYRLLKGEIIGKEPNFTFTDRAGRNWNAKGYLTMLSKTVMHNMQREVYLNTLANEGNDLVKVSSHGTTCHKCRPYEGKVLSVSGQSEDYPSVSSAKANGLFHPNCKHRLMVYIP